MNAAQRQQKLDEARRLGAAGDSAGAARICNTLLRANRADVQALHLLGVLAAMRADHDGAVLLFGRCVALAPHNALFHNDLARVHALAGDHAQALAGLQRALALQPDNPRIATDLADVLERNGQQAAAWQLLEPFVQAGSASADMALVALRLLDHLGRGAEAIALGQSLLAQPAGDDSTRRFLLQQLGRLHDKAGDAEAAFSAFAEAKQSERHGFDGDAHVRSIDALIEAFSAQALARLPLATNRSEKPVFIACMPRSGSTLVEQVLHAHPQAFGAGETPLLHEAIAGLQAQLGSTTPYPRCVGALQQADVDHLAQPYLRALDTLAPGAARVTNKHLLNYIHLGMVALLFPGARVIHIQRDPLDNGLACFMTSLSPTIMPWASNLQSIGLAFGQYQRLMAHWRATLPLQMLEVRYEDLVHDTEAQVRRIVDFCGLPWDERCLRWWEADRVVLTPSYDQVRRPIFHTAVGRWRRYAAFLQPLQAALR